MLVSTVPVSDISVPVSNTDIPVSDMNALVSNRNVPMSGINIYMFEQISVVIATGVLACVNIWSFTKLEQDFNLYDYIPDDSYATEYIHAQTRLYPDRGYDAAVYCGKEKMGCKNTTDIVYIKIASQLTIESDD